MNRERRTYCRLCYARIPGYRGASVPCPACGEQHLRAHEERYWTLEPRLVRLERRAKAASLVLALGMGWWLWVRGSAKASLGMGQLYAVVSPLIVLLILWMSASKITHRPTNFRAGTMWTVMLPATGAAAAYLAASSWSEEASSKTIAILLLVAAAPQLLLGPFAYRTTRWHRDWRTRYLEERLHEAQD